MLKNAGARAQPVVLKLIGDPRTGVADARKGVELQSRVHIHVIEIDRGVNRGFVGDKARGVVGRIEFRIPHQLIHRSGERLELRALFEHPGERRFSRE